MEPLSDPLIARLPLSVQEPVAEAVREGTWSKVRRAIAAFEHCPREELGPETTIQILASFEITSIEPAIRLGLHCVPCRPRLHIAPLNTIEQEFLDRESTIYLEKSAAVVVLWRAEELMPNLLQPGSSGGGAFDLAAVVAQLAKMVEIYAESTSIPLFLGTLPLPAWHGRGVLGIRPNTAVAEAVASFNGVVFKLSKENPRVHVLDVNWWAAQEGGSYYDLQMDLLARQPFTVKAAISFGLFLGRALRPLMVPRHKVLVVDLDNTLWGGILEEDGAAHLRLGHDSPGNVYLQIQREILELKKQGVLLVLASKNEEAAVRNAFDQLPNMLVNWSDFSARKVNFEPKYANLRSIAAELGLGLDSFAFLDDSDFEREQIKSFNPEVLVLNQSSNAVHMLSSLRSTDAFDLHKTTVEDLKRSREYELRSSRDVTRADNLDDFLLSLQLRAVLEPVDDVNLDRAVQMLGKTNQFNLTTRRYQSSELKAMVSRAGSISLALRLIDKFGDQGIVAILLATPGRDSGSLDVDSFLLSCRALGRGAEDVLWAELTTRAAEKGYSSVNASYLPTQKNQMVAGLYDRLGLNRYGESQEAVRYILKPVVPAVFPKWIAVERQRL